MSIVYLLVSTCVAIIYDVYKIHLPWIIYLMQNKLVLTFAAKKGFTNSHVSVFLLKMCTYIEIYFKK